MNQSGLPTITEEKSSKSDDDLLEYYSDKEDIDKLQK